MRRDTSDELFKQLLKLAGVHGHGTKGKWRKVYLAFLICWVPIAIITLIQGTFWTGDVTTSFITSFDLQARVFVSLPIFILAEPVIRARLQLILGQFINSGIILEKDKEAFNQIVEKNSNFLKSRWTDLIVLIVVYLQIFFVTIYLSENSGVLSWQVMIKDGETTFGLAGLWSNLFARPIVLFLFYRWLVRCLFWGLTLRKISQLDLNLFAVHPDLAGGLGFLGYSIRYFSPIAFAVSASIAGSLADLIMDNDIHLIDVRFPVLGYIVFLTLIFALPLLSFMGKLINAHEKTVFEGYDYANGIFRELRVKMSKDYHEVTSKDLSSPDFSTAADLSAVMNNAQNMRYFPFTLKDFLPLWIMSVIPFFGVIIIEIPFSELLLQFFNFVT